MPIQHQRSKVVNANHTTDLARPFASPDEEWPGFETVAATIREMVLDLTQSFGFGTFGQKPEAELVPLTDLVRVLDDQVTRTEIIAALDELQAAGEIALWFSDDGVCAMPKHRSTRWASAKAANEAQVVAR